MSHQLDNADCVKAEILFLCLFIGVLAYIVYKFFLPCFETGRRASPPRSRPSPGSGWFSGSHNDYRRPPPPPYTKYPDNNSTRSPSQAQGDQDRFGFWSGAALGGLGTYFLTRQRNPEPQPRRYDWEDVRSFPRRDPDYPAPRASGSFSPQRSWSNSRAGSSSNLRTSTGYGSSTVR